MGQAHNRKGDLDPCPRGHVGAFRRERTARWTHRVCRACERDALPRCLSCGGPTGDRQSVRCRACHQAQFLAGRTCPGCGARKAAKAGKCRPCAGLARKSRPTCPGCGKVNMGARWASGVCRSCRGTRPLAVRLWEKVSIVGACWEYGRLGRSGYGMISVGSPRRGVTVYAAHRLSLELALGRPLAPGMFACHTCDNRRCVRPSHLYEGTPSDNSRDAQARNPVLLAVAQAMRDAATQARKGVA